MAAFRFGRRARARAAAQSLYLAAVAQARRPDFYERLGVADSVAGRFEMVALHVFLILHRLKGEGGAGERVAQALFDAMFADMDRSLREMGTGDLAVGRKVRRLAESFYGRIAAYDEGLAAGGDALAAAVQRNLYAGGLEPGAGPARTMAAYLRREAARLAGQGVDEIAAGRVTFGPPPAGADAGADIDPGGARP